MFLSCPEFDIFPIFFIRNLSFLLPCLLFNENLPRKFSRKSCEIGRFLREFVSSNPVKFHFFSRELSEALDRVREKIKNYVRIFRHIMQKNMLIMRKTRWIMWKFKQFITLIIVSFHCFFSYLNCLVRFLLLRLFKFILTISLNYKFPRASSSQVQFLINVWFQKISIPPPRKGFFI